MADRLRAAGLAALGIVTLLGCGARSILDTPDETSNPGGGSSSSGSSSSGFGGSTGSSSGIVGTGSSSGFGGSTGSSSGFGGSTGSSSGFGGSTGSSSGFGGSTGSSSGTTGMIGTVPCGAMTCNAATSQCCLQGLGRVAGAACIPAGQVCAAGVIFGCVDTSNCPAGDVCCLSLGGAAGTGAAASSECQTSCGTIGAGNLSVQLCTSTASCPAGLTCVQRFGVTACD